MSIEPTGRIEPTAEGRDLVIVRSVRAPIEDVWASLTEPARFERWYGTMEGEPGPGATVMVTMTAEENSAPEPARIQECDPPDGFSAELGADDPPWRVAVRLVEEDGVTTLTFVHHLTPEIDATDVGPGWEYYADRLEAAHHDRPMPDWEGDGYQAALAPHYGGA